MEDTTYQNEIDLRHYAAILWRWAWLIALSALLAAGAAFLASRLQTPVYQASTTLLVNQAPDSQSSEYTAILTSERLARTYAELITTRPVLEETVSRLDLNIDLEDLRKAIDVQLVRDTQLIELKVEHTAPALAVALANTLVAVFAEQNDALQASRFAAPKESLKARLDLLSEQIQSTEAAIARLGTARTESARVDLERLQADLSQYRQSYTNLLQSYEEIRLAEARTVSNIVQVEPAGVPDEPVRPRVLLNTLLAGVAGGMLALGAIFLIEYLDDTIRTPGDVERIFQVPVLGYVAESDRLGSEGRGRTLLTEDPPPVIAEAFRSLRTNLEFSGNVGGPRTILISSPGPGDGKTTIASYLAATIAKGGKRAILIDADLRRPGVHRFFGVKNELGLSDMLKDDLVPQVATQTLGNHRFKLITSGTPVDNAAELFRSLWLLKVLNFLREQADVAIFDGPPFLATEAYILASRLESVLIVIQPGKTHEPAARAILEQLKRAQANLMGVVLNRLPRSEAYPAASYLYYENERDERRGSNPGKPRSATKRSTGAAQPTRGQPLHLRKDDPDR